MKDIIWLEYCKSCGHKHKMTQKLCPSCGKYDTPQPISEKVTCASSYIYDCDGCVAYRDHTNPY